MYIRLQEKSFAALWPYSYSFFFALSGGFFIFARHMKISNVDIDFIVYVQVRFCLKKKVNIKFQYILFKVMY